MHSRSVLPFWVAPPNEPHCFGRIDSVRLNSPSFLGSSPPITCGSTSRMVPILSPLEEWWRIEVKKESNKWAIEMHSRDLSYLSGWLLWTIHIASAGWLFEAFEWEQRVGRVGRSSSVSRVTIDRTKCLGIHKFPACSSNSVRHLHSLGLFFGSPSFGSSSPSFLAPLICSSKDLKRFARVSTRTMLLKFGQIRNSDLILIQN